MTAALLLTVTVGCDGPPLPGKPPATPNAGVVLTLACPDPALAPLLGRAAASWAAPTGATVRVAAGPMAPGDDADVGVLRPAELGAWADRGELLPVPAAVRAAGHPYQWGGVGAAYRERLAAWGGQAVGLPLGGDGHVVVYRSDRLADPRVAETFRRKFGRPPAPPATWEDFAELAEALAAADGKPSLPPLPADPARLADDFFRVAAGLDRGGPRRPEGSELGFTHRLDGAPRLEAKGFVAAAGWLARVDRCRANGPPDAAAALADGRASLAVLSLAELARLPRENGAVAARFGLAPLPGVRAALDPVTGLPAGPPGPPTYVPYLSGGWVGVVRTRCPHPDQAFDLLAHLGGPAGGLDLIGATTPGVGPFRPAQIDTTVAWLGYGFDPKRTGDLRAALRHDLDANADRTAVVPRGPDQAALTAALAAELKAVAEGKVGAEEAMGRAAGAWRALDKGHPADVLVRWRRKAAGLN